MNLAVLPDYFSTRVVTFVVTVFFGPSPSSKVMIFAMASGYSFASFWPPFWRFAAEVLPFLLSNIMHSKVKMNTKATKANAKQSENIQSALSCF